jgi:hypothetical protein
MPIDTVKSGTLGAFNVGLAAGVGFLVPMGAQMDALVASGLGPFQADLSAQLNAALSASANLTVSVGDPTAGIRSVLASLSGIQTALAQALAEATAFPSENLAASAQYSTQLSAMTALAATLGAQLGALQQAVSDATNVKLPALREAASLTESINAGPAFFIDFDGPLGTVGGELAAQFAGGLVDGSNVILPTQHVYGVLLLSSVPSVQTALSAIIKAP